MNLDKDISSWAKVQPGSVAAMSGAAQKNVLTMALHDIAVLGAEVERLRTKLQTHCLHLTRTHDSNGWHCPNCDKSGPGHTVSTCM